MRNILDNKKGDVFQIFIVLIITTAVAIVALILLVMSNQVTHYWNESSLMINDSVADKANKVLIDTGPKTTDYAIFFLFLGLNIGVIIAAARTNFSATIIFFICRR